MGLDLNGERFAAKRLGNGPVGITLRASLADRAGFEPAVAVTPRTLSKRVP